MKLNKILAGVLACCVVGGALPSVAMTADNAAITVSAAGDEDYTECTEGVLTYKNYGNYIEITGCDESAASVVIPAEIGGVTVTRIGDYAFGYCKGGLTEITIPNSVTSIGDWAFCNCSGLTSITLTDSVTSIDTNAFYGCTGLTEITIPDSVTSIGYNAFFYCTRLTSINVSDNNNNYADIDGVLFNKDKTKLHSYPIGKSETKYTIPDSVTSIGDWAFYECEGLTEITLSNSLTSIGERAFYDCSGLTEITIPDSVTSISDGAFCLCSGLTEITIPDSVTSIDDEAFAGCSGLTEITIPDSVTSIGYEAFEDCTGLTEITIPDSVTSIGDSAFAFCSGLKKITILNPNCEIYYYASTISDSWDEVHGAYFNGTIYGYENSTAQAYAEYYDRKFVALGADSNTTEDPTTSTTTDNDVKVTLIGDANCDGKVSIADSTAILQHLGNEDKYSLSPQGQKNADCCNPGDGITGLDAIAIQKLDAKTISSLPEISDKNN